MQVVWNPKDTHIFASASLDRNIKVWGTSGPAAHFTLTGHTRGVNCLEYSPMGDKPYLVSGADDKTVSCSYHNVFAEIEAWILEYGPSERSHMC